MFVVLFKDVNEPRSLQNSCGLSKRIVVVLIVINRKHVIHDLFQTDLNLYASSRGFMLLRFKVAKNFYPLPNATN